MADFTAPPGKQTTLMQQSAVDPASGTVAKSIRFPDAPAKFTVWVKGESTDVTWAVYAVLPFGDVSLGSITASTAGKGQTFSTDVAAEVKVVATNAHATVAKWSTVVMVSAK